MNEPEKKLVMESVKFPVRYTEGVILDVNDRLNC